MTTGSHSELITPRSVSGVEPRLQNTTPRLFQIHNAGVGPTNRSQQTVGRWHSKISRAELTAIHQLCYAPLGCCIGPEMQIGAHSNQGGTSDFRAENAATRAGD